MSGDIYASLSGARAAWTGLELLSNNIANASTTGFKADRMTFRSEGPGGHVLGASYAVAEFSSPDERAGTVVSDGVPTHLALEGRGWFALSDPSGPLFTRDGRFSLDTEGRLVGAGGRLVVGRDGPIQVPEGETIRIDEIGTVFGSESGEIGLIQVQDAPVRALGDNLYLPTGPIEVGDARVIQGGLESSNVDPLSAMVSLIEATRYVEAFQKAMQASDELSSRLNRVGGR